MPVTCLIVGCGSRSNRDYVQFYRVPSVLNYTHLTDLNILSRKRRESWLAAIKRDDLTALKLKHQRVCSKHFITGKPAALEEETHPDWVPSQNMGHTSCPFTKRKSDVCRTELRKRRMDNKSLQQEMNVAMPVDEVPQEEHTDEEATGISTQTDLTSTVS